MDIYNFVSLSGLVVLIALAWLFSTSRREVNWHVVVWGLSLQFLFAWFLFVLPAGVKFFLFINDLVVKVMGSAAAGAEFVFGRLALPPGATSASGETSLGFILGFQALPTIIFFSALMSILYFFNIMPAIIRGFAYLFTKLMKVSGAESLCAASNIFVGVESALTVQPFLKDMTRSELCTILTAGMATVSSNILALYVFSLKDVFPNIAGHLVSASLLSAPAALVMSKVLLPEESAPKTLGENVRLEYNKEDNLFAAVIAGAQSGVHLIVGIAALLIAVLGLVALLDHVLMFAGKHINAVFSFDFNWTLKELLGIVFYPLTVILGIPPADAGLAARIIGERMVVTEVASYKDLADALSQGLIQHPRTAVITAYALCGFAHLASMAIFVGGIAALVPEKTGALAQVAPRALCAATLACLMTGCIAGVFYSHTSIVLGAYLGF